MVGVTNEDAEERMNWRRVIRSGNPKREKPKG